ncbi:hypothetical protein Y032_0020g117 [Ancylostoma ceylanicum]|uniref:Uncharacterized protein n=1 Tax=Ancylostoma ceylanicum TaxID=53326 RepID=A0A016UZM3_9BILA|nr:hypothetical protein Y032_0020g117 [Ancylostoma ceylanicum]
MSSCVCPLPCSCSRANVIADSLGVSPMYHQKDAARWNSAASIYQAMTDAAYLSRHHHHHGHRKSRSALHSPEREHGNSHSALSKTAKVGGSMYDIR